MAKKIIPYPENLLRMLIREEKMPTKEALEEALTLLSDQKRELIDRYYKLHQTQAKIAADLKIGKATCCVRIKEAMGELDKMVEREVIVVPRLRLVPLKPRVERGLLFAGKAPLRCQDCVWPQRVDEGHYVCPIISCQVR